MASGSGYRAFSAVWRRPRSSPDGWSRHSTISPTLPAAAISLSTRCQPTTPNGASRLLTKQFQIGLVGYFYDQLTSDSGCAPILCPFESRVIGVGPQVEFIFPVAGMQGYLNLKAYAEFDNANRPDGWNVWVTFVLSPAPAGAGAAAPPMVTKAPPYS